MGRFRLGLLDINDGENACCFWVLKGDRNMEKSPSLQGREVVIGVTGGIAAYKAATLVSRLVQASAGVTVVMTEAATHLVSPKTFEALSRRPVALGMWDTLTHPHIELAQEADILCVAPATANFLAKAALGLADDLLSTLVLAFSGPIFVAPAMNVAMWQKPVVQRNLQQLRQDGIHIIEPESGYLSCGMVGAGRMAEPEQIFERLVEVLRTLPPREKKLR